MEEMDIVRERSCMRESHLARHKRLLKRFVVDVVEGQGWQVEDMMLTGVVLWGDGQ